MVNRLHRKVKGHKFHNRTQTCKRRACGDPCKPVFGDGCINHAARSEFIKQSLGDFVGPLVFCDLFTDQINGVIAAHFFGHGVPQRFAHGLLFHGRIRRPIGGGV